MTNDAAYAYDFPEVARRLALSERSVRNLANRGELPTITVLGKRRVTHRALLDFIEGPDNARTGKRHLRAVTSRVPPQSARGIGRPIG
jgi:hypothetical protein